MNNVLLLIVISAIAGGSAPPFTKVALEIFQPFTLVFIRFFFALLVLLPIAYKKGLLSINSFKKLFIVSLVGSLNPFLLFIALQFTVSSVAPLIYAAIPLMTVVYFAIWNKHGILKRNLLGLLIGFLGVVLTILLPFFNSAHVDSKSVFGNILIFIAAIAFLAYGIMSKKKQQQYNFSPIALTFYFCLVSMLISIPFSLYELFHHPVVYTNIRWIHVISSIEIGVVGTGIFYIAYQKALQKGTEVSAALFTYLQPIATIIFAVLLLGEKITWPFIVGGLLAVVGAQIAAQKS